MKLNTIALHAGFIAAISLHAPTYLDDTFLRVCSQTYVKYIIQLKVYLLPFKFQLHKSHARSELWVAYEGRAV